MADPKFANLPGIAYDQPDCFETTDVPESETSDYYEEEPENDSILRLHISAKDSYNKFKGKYLTGYVDFSDRLGKKLRTGYDARSEYELAADGERETPIQRCRRLQCEMNELMEEITVIQSDSAVSKEEKESYEAVSTVVNSAKKVLESLKLEQVLGKETVANSADAEVKRLMSQVEDYKKSGISHPLNVPTSSASDLSQSTRIAELENRLHQLEIAIGARPEKVTRLANSMGTNNLLEVVQQLSTRAALLQPNQLDLIEARLGNLVTKMDVIVEKSSGANQDAARDQKTLELYEIAKRTEPITQILPDMLKRMKALESLHTYATNFSKLILELDANQANISGSISNNKVMLQGIQQAFAENLESVNKEITKLDERIKVLTVTKK